MLTKGFTLAGCPEEVSDAWRLIPFDYPFTASPKQSQSIFSGPALLAMQSERAALTVTPKEEHISHLSNAGRIQRLAAQKKIEKAIEEALRKTRNKDGTPKKSLHKDAPVRSDEEQKFRKVVQHELQHHDMSMPKLPQKRPRPTQLLTPPASPPNTSLKSILKVNHLPNDIDELSPLKRILILRTASAKLNYLLKRIQALHETEKIIVFSDYGPMMWYLGEALEILGIEHLIYIQRLVPSSQEYTDVDASTASTVHCDFQFLTTFPSFDNGDESSRSWIECDCSVKSVLHECLLAAKC